MVTLLLFQRFGRAFYGTIDPCNALANLFLPLAADNSQHGLGVRRLLQSLAKLRFVQQFGIKQTVLCNTAWSNERWLVFGVEEFPDMDSVQKHNAAQHELDWFRYVDSETMLGTAWASDT